MELLINMTIGGTVTACLILLIKQLLKSRLTPKWHFYIWIILALRLVIPGLPESDFSLLNAIPTTQNITTVQHEAPNVSDAANTAGSGYVEGNIVIKSPVTGEAQKRPFSVSEHRVNLLFAGWLTGAVLMAGYLIEAYWLFIRKTKKLPACRDAEILELFEECKSEAGVVSDRISLRTGGLTPMLRGILQPIILIPEGYSKEELRHVLIHELCHYKHKDIFVNMVCSAFLCAYWFNPVFWLCFYIIRRDVEFLCDERVIEITGDRKEYSKTLLKTALRKNRFIFATTSMQNGEKEVAKRIKHIAYFKKPKLWISMLAAAAVLVTGVVCLTDATAINTANADVGGGYFIKVPENWINYRAGDLQFINEKGESFGGAYLTQMDLGSNKETNFESVGLPLPNHSQILERKVIKGEGDTLILVNLDMDSETASQIAERNDSGDNRPSEKINQNYIFILPDQTNNEIYVIWADSRQVTERQLLKIAGTFRENPYPEGYRPETAYQDNWTNTASSLLKDYFKNYVDADMSVSSDISGYRIDGIIPFGDTEGEASWSVIYPDVVVMQVDYTLSIAYPDQYSFAGGGFGIGEGNKTKIYKDQLAVFRLDNLRNAKFLGFVWPQDRGELGDSGAILRTLSYTDPAQSPEALLKLKTPYIGNNSAVGRILGSMPLAQYSTGMELHTKAEPYGLTVDYDMTGPGGSIFTPRLDKALTDSSGWELRPALREQFYKNSAILLALIDNCSSVEFRIKGVSDTGTPYTCYFLADRETLTKQLSQDPRSFAASEEAFTAFLNQLEARKMAAETAGTDLKGE